MDCSNIRINEGKISTVLSKYLIRIDKNHKSEYIKKYKKRYWDAVHNNL